MMDLKRAEERADVDDVEKKLWRFEKVLEDERMKYGKDSNNFLCRVGAITLAFQRERYEILDFVEKATEIE